MIDTVGTDQRDADALEYIQAMLGQLRLMAYSAKYPVIAHFIEMAYIQAEDTAKGLQPAYLHDDDEYLEQRNSVA